MGTVDVPRSAAISIVKEHLAWENNERREENQNIQNIGKDDNSNGNLCV